MKLVTFLLILFFTKLISSPASVLASKGTGIPSVESPGSFNPPSNPGSAESPVKLSDREEQLYVEKVTVNLEMGSLRKSRLKSAKTSFYIHIRLCTHAQKKNITKNAALEISLKVLRN